MEKARRVIIYKAHILCPICKGNMHGQSGSRGQFYSCNDYPRCNGSRDATQATFSVYSIKGIEILNNSIIGCTVNGIGYDNLEVQLSEGCFGVEVEDTFVLLKECDDIFIESCK
jgi:ssDNA-binding Zn-finger/Zn-ribbon topoisomerase 1